MVLAAFIADSLALGAHWIYDTDRIAQQFGTISDLLPASPEGYHPTKQRGEFTHYGDQMLHLLDYLCLQQGQFIATEYFSSWVEMFSHYSGYLDRAMKTSLENHNSGRPNLECGSASTDLGGPARFAPLLFCCVDDETLSVEYATALTRLTHNSPAALASSTFLARSCCFLLQGAQPREAFQESLDKGINDIDLEMRLYAVLDRSPGDVIETVKELGQMCGAAAALPGSIYTVLSHEESLENALIATVMAGGDSAARGMTVGMLLGAFLGETAIPPRWLAGLSSREHIQHQLTHLARI